MREYSGKFAGMTIGLDLGDKYGQYYTLDEGGENIDAGRVTMLPGALEKRFGGMERSRIVMESGTHSAWVSRLLEGLGHEVIVANARKLRLISENENKDDAVDAELLARVGRVDPKLLYPIQHRGAEVQADLAVVRAREALVKARGQLINHLRGAVKSVGGRLPKCSTASFHRRVEVEIPAELEVALRPLLEMIEEMSGQIRAYEEEVERLCHQKYPETELLRQVGGVGPLTSLCYVLTLEDPHRFAQSRSVGSFLGLRPGKDQSGQQDPELRITKTGNPQLRRLLVQSAQQILGPFGADCDLRRWGLQLAGRGRKNAKKRAVVAVARKLAVLLHRLWIQGEVYEPFYQSQRPAVKGAACA
jgi:transposase